MAQLSDDCFAFGGALLPLAQARAEILDRHSCVAAARRVGLARVSGRILAQDVVAAMNLPPNSNSAVDGYAVHHADLHPDAPTALPVRARIAAGAPFRRLLAPAVFGYIVENRLYGLC